MDQKSLRRGGDPIRLAKPRVADPKDSVETVEAVVEELRALKAMRSHQ